MELLCERAALDNGYLELETEAGLKSRVRENRTHGSVRGSRQAFHKVKLRKECRDCLLDLKNGRKSGYKYKTTSQNDS